MDVYLESYDNPVMQIFAEFDMFLYVITHTCTTNRYLQNAINDSRRIHIRALIHFFNNTGKKNDDLFSKNFLASDHFGELSISLDKIDIIPFINKYTAHITKERGKIKKDDNIDTWFTDISRELVTRINKFIRLLDCDVNPIYAEQYHSEDVQIVKSSVLSKIIYITIQCTLEEVKIEL